MAKEIKKAEYSVPYIKKDALLKQLKDDCVGIDKKILDAIRQAEDSHKDQLRDDGGPYLEQHIYPVVSELIKFYNDKMPGRRIPEELILGGLLHDVLEDDLNITNDEFIEKFGKKIFDIIKTLTKPDHEKNISQRRMKKINEEILKKILKSNKLSILIKLSDRLNNMEAFFGFKKLDFPKFHRYMQEVEKDYLPYTKKNNKYFYDRLYDVTHELKRRLRIEKDKDS